jgi:LysM repeat protein
MAAKKGKTTRKYKQAKQAAKPAAKAAFSGKVQASRKDPKIKISAEDKMALKDMKDTAKADLGKNAYLSKAEYEANQAKAREAFRERMRTEFGEYGGKKASAAEAAMKETKAGGKKTKPKAKAPAAKPSVISAKGPSLVENGKVVSQARAEEIMSGEKKSAPKKKTVTKKAAVKKAAPSKPSAPATSKAATVAEPTTKPAVKKPATKKKAAAKKASAPKVTRPTDASLTAMEDEKLKQTKEKLIKQGKLSGSTELAIRPKGTVASTRTGTVATTTSRVTPIPGSDTVVKKKGFLRKAGGKFVPAIVAGELVSLAKGSTYKDLNEIDRLKAKLGNKKMSAKEGMATQASNLASLVSMGLVGQTRRERMDELNAKIKKKEAATKKANKGLRYGPDGSSLVPGTDAYKKGSKTRPVKPVAPGAAGGTSGGATGGKSGGASGATPGAGGSTITATPGSTYTVKKGDTLSAIAKASGVSLAEIRKANKKFTTNPKYKQGSMIWSGTKVNIPKK